jgi:hypothetical protein
MNYLSGEQLGFFNDVEEFYRPVGDWYDPDDLGSVTTLPKPDPDNLGSVTTLPKPDPDNLGSVTTLPKSDPDNLGSVTTLPNSLLPKSIPVHIGLIQRKLNNATGNYYWYWRYYDLHGKYRSIYLGADVSQAIAKCQSRGIPPDASKKYLKDR